MGDTQDKEPLQPSSTTDRPSINSTARNGSVSSGTPDFGYEELSNGLTCPTCQGTGKIPRGQEDDLVALIPYRDDRLKPRRTTLYVCLAVFICMAIAGVLCAFLVPRPISFIEDKVQTIAANQTQTAAGKKVLKLSLMNHFNVSNENFLQLHITNITQQVISTFRGHVISDQKMQPVFNITIPIRTKEQQFQWPVNVTIDNDDFPIEFCTDPQTSHGIYMIFQTTLYYSFMFRDSQSSLTHYQLVSCIGPDHRFMMSRRMLNLNNDWQENR